MTILVYGEKASRTHENQMLHVFLDRLEERWANSTDWIITIANAMWNGAEIDLVCILPSAIVVADFKSYGGKLTGTENGPWQADGVIVKGGRKANPTSNCATTSSPFLTGCNQRHCCPDAILATSLLA